MKRKIKEKASKNKKFKESSKKLKEKVKSKDKDKDKKQPQKMKNIIINTNEFQICESIVKIILDKIISNSVRKANLNSIINKIDDYYFDYLKNQISAMFSTSNIFYSDEPENPIIDNSNFWKTDYNKCNTWVEVEEPHTIRCDRFENAFMNYVNLNADNDEDITPLTNSDKKQNNKKDKVSDKKGKNLIQKFGINLKNNKNNLDVLEEKSSKESVDEGDKTHSKMTTQKKFFNNSTKTIFNKSLAKNSNLNSVNVSNSIFPPNKRKKNGILEMDFKEIPGINEEYDYEKYEPSNINFLRREREDQILRKAKEGKKIFFNLQNKADNNQNIHENEEISKEIKNIKLFDSNKLTFDSNGKIISFKPIKIDIFSKDFALLKNSVRSFKKRRNTLRKSVKIKDDNESIKEKEKEKEKEKNNITNIENVIKNPADSIEGNFRNQHMKLLLEKNEKIIPSGSNFSLMFPNIGVVLKENENVKKGNRDFGKYFKKYSLEDYDKILKDYVPLQNKTIMLNKMGSVTRSPLNRSLNKQFLNNTNLRRTLRKKNNNDINDNLLLSSFSLNNNNNNNNSVMINNNSEISNPLINQEKENETFVNNNVNNNTSNLNYNLIKTMKLNKNSFNNSLISSINNFNTLSVSRNNNNINNINSGQFEGSIKTKDGISSLKVEFDSLKDLDYKNINNYYSPSRTGMKNINIFGRNYKEIFKNLNKDKNISKDVNELNKKIITNNGWGNKTMRKNMSTGNLLFSKHQTRYQAIREIGNNILNSIKVKLPRNRKIKIQI